MKQFKLGMEYDDFTCDDGPDRSRVTRITKSRIFFDIYHHDGVWRHWGGFDRRIQEQDLASGRIVPTKSTYFNLFYKKL